jgi:hypothetical protein
MGLSSKLSGSVFCKCFKCGYSNNQCTNISVHNICSDPSGGLKELNQFTPEEIDAIKAVLKQQQQDQDK